MKNSTIIGLVAIGIISTSSITFANDIEILNKNKFDYIPVKSIIQKSGGKVDISESTAKITIDGKSIVIDKNLSFAKINDNYYPINTKKIKGIEVPVDIKPIFEKSEVYIEKDFFKDYKIANYKIEKNKIKVTLDDKTKPEPSEEKDKKEKIKEEEKNLITTENLNENLKKSHEVSEVKSVTKVQRPSRQTKPENIHGQTKLDTNSSDTKNNSLEDDKKDTEKITGDIKPDDIKKENQQNDLPKTEVPNEKQQQDEVE